MKALAARPISNGLAGICQRWQAASTRRHQEKRRRVSTTSSLLRRGGGLIDKPTDVLSGVHKVDPWHCRLCWEQDTDPLYRQLQELVGIQPQSIEHGETEVMGA